MGEGQEVANKASVHASTLAPLRATRHWRPLRRPTCWQGSGNEMKNKGAIVPQTPLRQRSLPQEPTARGYRIGKSPSRTGLQQDMADQGWLWADLGSIRGAFGSIRGGVGSIRAQSGLSLGRSGVAVDRVRGRSGLLWADPGSNLGAGGPVRGACGPIRGRSAPLPSGAQYQRTHNSGRGKAVLGRSGKAASEHHRTVGLPTMLRLVGVWGGMSTCEPCANREPPKPTQIWHPKFWPGGSKIWRPKYWMQFLGPEKPENT